MSGKRALCFLCHSGLGGAERIALDSFDALREEGYDVVVVLPGPGPIEQALKKERLPYEFLPFGSCLESFGSESPINLFRLIKVLVAVIVYKVCYVKIVHKYSPSVLVTHGLKLEVVSALCWVWTRVPIIWYVHLFPPKRVIVRFLYRLLSRIPAFILTDSQAVLKAMPKRKNIAYVYPFVQEKHFQVYSTSTAEKKLGLSLRRKKTDIVIGMVTVFARWKGIDDVLYAFAPLLEKNQNIHFLLVGGALYQTDCNKNYANTIDNLIKDLKLKDHVTVLPFQNSPNLAYSTMDIVVHASKQPEPFGRVATEAMCCGKALIASAGGGILEQVKPGRNALVFKMGDRQELSRKLRLLIEDKRLRSRLGTAAARVRQTIALARKQYKQGIQRACFAACQQTQAVG